MNIIQGVMLMILVLVVAAIGIVWENMALNIRNVGLSLFVGVFVPFAVLVGLIAAFVH